MGETFSWQEFCAGLPALPACAAGYLGDDVTIDLVGQSVGDEVELPAVPNWRSTTRRSARETADLVLARSGLSALTAFSRSKARALCMVVGVRRGLIALAVGGDAGVGRHVISH